MTRQQRWARNNPDKRRAICRNYRQRKPEDRERKNERNRRYYHNRRQRNNEMARPRKNPATTPPPEPPKLPEEVARLRRQVNYTPEVEREMQEQAEQLHEWVKGERVRSSAKLREMRF